MAKSLFHKAISESTWINTENVTDLKSANGFSESAEVLGGRAIATALDMAQVTGPDTLSKMRSLSAQEVLDLEHGVTLIVDGWLYDKAPIEIFEEGSHNNVPIITGSLAASPSLKNPITHVPSTGPVGLVPTPV